MSKVLRTLSTGLLLVLATTAAVASADSQPGRGGCGVWACSYCDGISGNCTTCENGYALVPVLNACFPCQTAHCASCTYEDPFFCSFCERGYQANVNTGTCQPCGVARCANCLTDINTCDECEAGTYMDADTGSCVACADPLCKQCEATGSNHTCFECADGYYAHPETGACTACAAANCAQCSTVAPSVCVSCAAGYGLLDGVCLPCADPNCQLCNGDTWLCAQCAFGSATAEGTCPTGVAVSWIFANDGAAGAVRAVTNAVVVGVAAIATWAALFL